MIIYKSTAEEFIDKADRNKLIGEIEIAYNNALGRSIPPAERSAYQNSLPRMATVLRRAGIAGDCGVLIEYGIQLTRKRVDFVVTGESVDGERTFLIIELKQWQKAEPVDGSNSLVETFVGGADRIVLHPSEQSLDYKNSLPTSMKTYL